MVLLNSKVTLENENTELQRTFFYDICDAA